MSTYESPTGHYGTGAKDGKGYKKMHPAHAGKTSGGKGGVSTHTESSSHSMAGSHHSGHSMLKRGGTVC